MGFGEGEGPLFQKGPLPLPQSSNPFLPNYASATRFVVAALDDVGINERAGLDAGAADVNHTVDFGELETTPARCAGRATPDGAHPRG